MKYITFQIDDNTLLNLRRRGKQEERSVSFLIRKAVENYLKKNSKDKED